MLWIISGEIVFAVLILFFLFLAAASLKEKEKRAFWLSSLAFGFLLTINGCLLLFLNNTRVLHWVMGCIFALFVLTLLFLYLLPNPRSRIKVLKDPDRIDERDVIFSRFELEVGSEHYQEYYSRKPENKPVDDRIRKLHDLFTPHHTQKDPITFSLASAEADFIRSLVNLADGDTYPEITDKSEFEYTRIIKKVLKYLGADIYGICALDKSFVYSHTGRGPEPYGQEITRIHKNAVVFALKMEYDLIAHAPMAPVILETENKYIEAARIAIITANFIRKLGFPARAHLSGSNYQAVLTPLAWKAGMGELGRMGILITPRYGPRIRLGLVTTDMPLIPDEPRETGIHDFCRICNKCSSNCPSQTIPSDNIKEENSVLKWTINREKCYEYWRKVGTDCSRCVFICPYSKPGKPIHAVVRKITSFSSAARRLIFTGDKILYGKFPKGRKKPYFT